MYCHNYYFISLDCLYIDSPKNGGSLTRIYLLNFIVPLNTRGFAAITLSWLLGFEDMSHTSRLRV